VDNLASVSNDDSQNAKVKTLSGKFRKIIRNARGLCAFVRTEKRYFHAKIVSRATITTILAETNISTRGKELSFSG
jgi:hypothetical protein